MPTPQQLPQVTVLMPVYNGERYLRQAIDSILHQTFIDFEFLIINDGSSDGSRKILEEYARKDGRIRLIHQKNRGLVATLNDGISKARAPYIARMDADDIAYDYRLERQMEFLDANPLTVLLGGGFEIMDEEGNFFDRIVTPTRDDDLRRTMYLRNPFGHAAVIFRKDIAIKAGLYDNSVGPAEDFDLWKRLAAHGEIAALPYSLMHYRFNMQGISQSNSEAQVASSQKIIQSLWKEQIPEVVSTANLRLRCQYYVDQNQHISYGVSLKLRYLEDNAWIGVKLIGRRHFLLGLRQLINVALVGRSGVQAVKIRLRRLRPRSVLRGEISY